VRAKAQTYHKDVSLLLPTSSILEATPNGFAEMNINVFTNYERIKEGPTKSIRNTNLLGSEGYEVQAGNRHS